MVNNPRSLHAIERLEKLQNVLKLYGVEQYISFDLGMLSKYNYYTGMIFKAYTYGVGDAIVKGGRYDKLLNQFGKEAPAVGFVMMVDSICEALTRQKLMPERFPDVTSIYYNQDNFAEKLAEVNDLRAKGITTALVPERK